MGIAVSTTFSFEGYRIKEYKGVVRGIIVRATTIAQGILGGLKNIIGGRIGAYTEMCEQARQQAYDLMLLHAQELGANAVVGSWPVLGQSSKEIGFSLIVGLNLFLAFALWFFGMLLLGPMGGSVGFGIYFGFKSWAPKGWAWLAANGAASRAHR